MIDRSPPELEVVHATGSVDLFGPNETPYGLVHVDALSDGTEWGNRESVRRRLSAVLSDGVGEDSDRTVTVKVRLSASDGVALAGGEAMLDLLRRVWRAELRWTPPNRFASTACFIVTAVDLAHEMDDLAENECVRFFTLTFTCLPDVRSLDSVVIEALPAVESAPATLWDWDSTVGWSVTDTSIFTVSVDSGQTIITGSRPSFAGPGSGNGVFALGVTLTERFLAIRSHYRQTGRGTGIPGSVNGEFESRSLVLKGQRSNGSQFVAEYVPVGVSADGLWAFYDVGVGVTVAEIRFFLYVASGQTVVTRFYEVAESSAAADVAGRQSLRTLTIPGSTAAPGTITVERRGPGPQGLDEVTVYSGPNYDPRLSIGRVQTGAPDTAALSGAVASGISTATFIRDAVDFPAGSYALYANASRNDGGTTPLDWTIEATLINAGGVNVADLGTYNATTLHPTGSARRMHPLALIDLPAALSPDTTLRMKLVFTTNGGELFAWDEGLLLHTAGSLTIVDTTIAGAARVSIETATLDHPPRIMRYANVLGEEIPASAATEITAWTGSHTLAPGDQRIYVGSTGALEPLVYGSIRACWATHPAEGARADDRP